MKIIPVQQVYAIMIKDEDLKKSSILVMITCPLSTPISAFEILPKYAEKFDFPLERLDLQYLGHSMDVYESGLLTKIEEKFPLNITNWNQL